MSLKSIVKNGIGSISSKCWLCRSKSHDTSDVTPIEPIQQGQWANLPPELLLDIIRRVEESETSWPARATVVFCASVCKSWRSVTKEIIKNLQQCGKITFPISLQQKDQRNFYISVVLRFDAMSNFWGNKFTIFDSQPPHDAAVQPNCQMSRRFNPNYVYPRTACRYCVSTISNKLFLRKPRSVYCVMNYIPISAIQEGGNPGLTPTSLPELFDETFSPSPALNQGSVEPLIFQNKAPIWDDQSKSWCLDFKGRVKVASAKNFQLLAAGAVGPSHNVSPSKQERIILQCGMIEKDIFIMDYSYPMSAFEAFVIFLTSICNPAPNTLMHILGNCDDIKPFWDCIINLDHFRKIFSLRTLAWFDGTYILEKYHEHCLALETVLDWAKELAQIHYCSDYGAGPIRTCSCPTVKHATHTTCSSTLIHRAYPLLLGSWNCSSRIAAGNSFSLHSRSYPASLSYWAAHHGPLGGPLAQRWGNYISSPVKLSLTGEQGTTPPSVDDC
ncbi:hypothetical protein TSUD_191820 [Trifolium subterraneum]|uniref:F-box domain-containing protein n=1 Tax=Trifolium subterraneum TaxID=3900 RepID=A0A2Z6P0V4_TRISU|nr:hypothetical protein TSUD_191820 [Trifolium subterraneum]